MTPGLAHALLALALQSIVAGLALTAGYLTRVSGLSAGVSVPAALVLGAGVAVGFYLGRERRQSEQWAGSNRIPPWVWKPRALRDFGWPLLAVVASTVGTVLLRGGG